MPTINLRLEVLGNADKTASVILQGKLAEAIKTVKDVKLVDISDDLSDAPRRRKRKNAASTAPSTPPPQAHSSQTGED